MVVSGRKAGLRVDMPCHWLNAAWWLDLTLEERGVYVSGLMLSQSQQLDGVILPGSLRVIDSDLDRVDALLDAIDEKTSRITRIEGGGWMFPDWEGMQEQSSAAYIENCRASTRGRSQRHREKKAEEQKALETEVAALRAQLAVTRDDAGDQRRT